MVFRKLIFDFYIIYGIIIMKDEKVWDYSICNIGSPCKQCIKCNFSKPTVVLNDQDEKEKENERTIEESKRT